MEMTLVAFISAILPGIVLGIVGAASAPLLRMVAVAMSLLAVAIFSWGLGLPYELFAFEFGR